MTAKRNGNYRGLGPGPMAAQWQRKPVALLKEWPRNPRLHPEAQVDQIAESIKAYGFTSPLIVDEAGIVLAGNGRLAAARKLGLADVPCVTLSGLSEAKKRAYVLADNKIAANSSWDKGLLTVELGELRGMEEIKLTGFSLLELAQALEPRQNIEDVPADPVKATTRPGDLYQMGRHRLLCGSATNADDVRRVAPKGWDCAVIDPPFEMDDITAFITDPCVVFGQMKHARQVPQELYRFERVIDKIQAHRVASTHVSHRHALVVQVGSVKTCPKDRNTYPSVVTFEERPNHPHQKPVWLTVQHLTAWIKSWETVYDPFAGSGTTIMAAEQLGRAALAIELEPATVDVIVRRWQRYTGNKARRLKA